MTLESTPQPRVENRRTVRQLAALFAASATTLLVATPASARPGTHPAAISTFDTRASSVVFAYRRGLLDGGGVNQLSYNANFTNTTGVLSSQFGVHYVSFKGGANETTQHGVAGSAIGLFNIPVTSRLPNGLPRVSFGPYLGVAPTALINGQQNSLSLPLVLGLSLPMSPAAFITITPWYELGLSIDLDTVVKPASLSLGPCQFITCDANGNPVPTDPANPPNTTLSADTVNTILAEGVEIDLSVNAPMRAGLDVALHMGDSSDFNLYAGLSTLGGGFSGTAVAMFGLAFTWRWDSIVPAVLPPERRLLHENCGDIEARFRTCPGSKRWRSPEELSRPVTAAPVAAPPAAPAAQPAPLPMAPAPEPAPSPVPSAPESPAVAPEPVPPPAAGPEAPVPPAAAFPN